MGDDTVRTSVTEAPFTRADLLRQFRRQLYLANKDRGTRSEERVLHALSPEHRPAWMRDVCKATAEQDHRGIDIVLKSDVGDLYIQVKSSRGGQERFDAHPRRRRLPVEVVIVGPKDTDTTIRSKVIAAATRRRNWVFRRRRHHGPLTS